MDNLEYNDLLSKAKKYFDDGKYAMFLDVFAKCYDFNPECFEDDINVFRFSLACYIVGGDDKINEFNRFSMLLEKYLQTYDTPKQKQDFIYKIRSFINNKFDVLLQGKSVINYQDFKNCTTCMTQQFEFLQLVTKLNLFDYKDFIQEEIADITKMIEILRKISRFTATRFIVHFPFTPNTPKKYFQKIEKKLKTL